MTAAVLALAVIVVGLLVLRERERRAYLHAIMGQDAAARSERASLLDRIQHPERTQVERVDMVPMSPPKDFDELGQVGQLVPEFMHVGTPEGSYGGSD